MSEAENADLFSTCGGSIMYYWCIMYAMYESRSRVKG